MTKNVLKVKHRKIAVNEERKKNQLANSKNADPLLSIDENDDIETQTLYEDTGDITWSPFKAIDDSSTPELPLMI